MSPQTEEFTIKPVGPFSLQEAALFGFGQREDHSFDGVMRLAFCLDGSWEQVGVEVRQDAGGVHCKSQGSTDVEAIRRQTARVLSLDFDGTVFTQIGRNDPVIGRLQEAAPGLRPPLFYSPYEAAVWVIMSARRPRRQVSEVRRRLSAAHGRTFQLAGQDLSALPTPEQLLDVREFAGLSAEKVARMHETAHAAIEGRLDAARLQRLGPEQANAELQELKGIGKFYGSLIVIRACGFADVLPTEEPRLLDLVARLYELPARPTAEELLAIAEAWRPMRTWAAVLIRAAADRL